MVNKKTIRLQAMSKSKIKVGPQKKEEGRGRRSSRWKKRKNENNADEGDEAEKEEVEVEEDNQEVEDLFPMLPLQEQYEDRLQKWLTNAVLLCRGFSLNSAINKARDILGFAGNKSESPTQAFLVLTLWLYRKFKPLLDAGLTAEQLDEKISQTVIAYDNMCHVDGLKLAKLDLPFQKPLDKMWQRVVKVIDRLHIRNHKDSKCKTVYNPDGRVPENTTPWQQNRRMCGRVD
ncbi:hypothetical protein ACROYT_G015264 [Oculina patagonica]